MNNSVIKQFEITDKRQKYFLVVIIVFLLTGLFVNLGIFPLYHEEPRRGLIALEMIFSDNWIVPTIHGEFYYNKPPFYNWILIMSYKLFGTYSEFATRFFSVMSFLLLGWFTYLITRKYVNKSLAIYSMLFFWIAADFLFYFSLTAEIDLFYSLITFIVFLSTFHFYQRKQWWYLFLSVYLFSAIGFLTKGLPSVAFAEITLLGYFISQKNFKGLISWAHLAGIFMFFLITGAYFYYYSRFNDPAGFLTTLYTQSTDRTSSDSGFMGFVTHLITFPAIVLKDLIPVAILVILFIPGKVYRIIRENKWISFAALVVILNIVPYWIAPGTRSRYIYMLYPLIVLVILYLASNADYSHMRKKIVNIIYGLLISLSTIVCIALPFVPQLDRFSYIPYLAVFGAVVSIAILYLFLRFENMRLLAVIAVMVLLRWIFNFTVSPVRQTQSNAGIDKQDAHVIASISDGTPVYVLNDTRMSYTTLYYLEAEKREIIHRATAVEPGNYYLSDPEYLEGIDYEIRHSFRYYDNELVMVSIE